MIPPPTNADMVSMRDYVDTRMVAMGIAVEKAEQRLYERLATMNEGRLVTRDAVDLLTTNLDKQMGKLEKRTWDLEQKQSHAEGRSWMMYTALGVGLTVLNIALSIALRILFP